MSALIAAVLLGAPAIAVLVARRLVADDVLGSVERYSRALGTLGELTRGTRDGS